MNYLPLFIDTSGKKCLIVGGGKVASRKLIPILESNMTVNMISSDIAISEEIIFTVIFDSRIGISFLLATFPPPTIRHFLPDVSINNGK